MAVSAQAADGAAGLLGFRVGESLLVWDEGGPRGEPATSKVLRGWTLDGRGGRITSARVAPLRDVLVGEVAQLRRHVLGVAFAELVIRARQTVRASQRLQHHKVVAALGAETAC